MAHRILLLGGGQPGYFAASEQEKRDVFLPAFRALHARWEELGARVVASFSDDMLQVGPSATAWVPHLRAGRPRDGRRDDGRRARPRALRHLRAARRQTVLGAGRAPR